jgi:hypothetical protein
VPELGGTAEILDAGEGDDVDAGVDEDDIG